MNVQGDNPIRLTAQDALGRHHAAAQLALDVRELDASEGVVVAVMGAWGAGKTSFINMAREELAGHLSVVEFNPWMFSGAEQLVDFFFVELAAQLRVKEGKLKVIANELADYGELLSPLSAIPVVGSWFDSFKKAGAALKKFQERRHEGVAARREKLAALLAQLPSPIVVVIDDIDRLTTNEIRDIFRLVRLTGNFPNIVYVLAFDRARVEQALTEAETDGQKYLDKIVQLPVDLPVAPQKLLLAQLGRSLESALEASGDVSVFDKYRWPDTLAEVILPQVENLRDVRRLALTTRGTLRSLIGQIELGDLVAMEATRVLSPRVFNSVTSARIALTSTGNMWGDDTSDKAAIQSFLRDSNNEVLARAIVTRLFPAAVNHLANDKYGAEWLGRWLRERRLAHPDILSLYLERAAPDSLTAFEDAQLAFDLFNDADALAGFLASIPPESQEDVISGLNNFEDWFTSDHAVVALPVLLNLLPTMPSRDSGGLFTLDARMVVGRIAYLLLSKVPTSDAEEVVRTTLPKLAKLSSKLELIQLVGHEDGTGHGFISQQTAGNLQEALHERVSQADPEDLAEEANPFRLLNGIQRWRPDLPALAHMQNERLDRAVLLGAMTVVRGQTQGSRAVTRSYRLSWDSLVRLYGSEEKLREAVARVRANESGSDETLRAGLELAAKYAGGWRPPE